MRETLERSGSWHPSRREMLGALGVGLLAPRIARAATFSLLSSVVTYFDNTSAAIDTTGANLIVTVQGGLNYGDLPWDSAGNSYTDALSVSEATAPNYLRFCYCYGPTTSATHTFRQNNSSIYCGLVVAAFGGAQTGPLDASTNSTTSASAVTTLSPGSITPTMSNEVLISGLCGRYANSSSPTVAGGMGLVGTVWGHGGYSWGVGMAYVIQTAAGAVNPAWSLSSSAAVAGSIAFKSTSSSGGAAPPVRRRVITGGE